MAMVYLQPLCYEVYNRGNRQILQTINLPIKQFPAFHRFLTISNQSTKSLMHQSLAHRILNRKRERLEKIKFVQIAVIVDSSVGIDGLEGRMQDCFGEVMDCGGEDSVVMLGKHSIDLPKSATPPPPNSPAKHPPDNNRPPPPSQPTPKHPLFPNIPIPHNFIDPECLYHCVSMILVEFV
jgi:hypothetical protein